MKFDWDSVKNQSNKVDHNGIGFEDAQPIFDGPVLSRLDSGLDRLPEWPATISTENVITSNLDRLAIIAGCAALEDQEWLQETTATIIRTRTHMLQALAEMGLHVPPSRTNFVFPQIPDGRALEVYEALEKRRILVRYFRAPLVADFLRVTVGTAAEVEAFLRALRELL